MRYIPLNYLFPSLLLLESAPGVGWEMILFIFLIIFNFSTICLLIWYILGLKRCVRKICLNKNSRTKNDIEMNVDRNIVAEHVNNNILLGNQEQKDDHISNSDSIYNTFNNRYSFDDIPNPLQEHQNTEFVIEPSSYKDNDCNYDHNSSNYGSSYDDNDDMNEKIPK